jgi:hypothetical protein
MGRPRKHDTDLPQRLFQRRGKFYYVNGDGQWVPLGGDREEAITAAERMNALSAEARLAAAAMVRDVGAELRRIVFGRDGHKCVYCGATDLLEIDHVVPAANGGASTVRNLVVACSRCNMMKSDGDLAAFFMKLHRVVERCLDAAAAK